MPNPYFQGLNTGSMAGAVASGFAAGGPIGAVASGVTNYFQQDAQMKQAIDAVNTDFNTSYDALGRPAFDSQGFGQGVQDLQGLMESTRPGAIAMRPKRRRQMEDKARELYSSITTGQQNYNTAESNYRDRMSQLSDYNSRQRTNYMNLYRFG